MDDVWSGDEAPGRSAATTGWPAAGTVALSPTVAAAGPLARLRESLRTERAAYGFIAGALLGLLAMQLGLGPITKWDFEMQDVLIFAILGSLGAASVLFLRVLWVADVTLFVLLCVIEMTPVMSGPVRRWIRSDPLPRSAVDAVIVPSSSVTSSGTLGVIGSDRLLSGLELVRRGVAPRLITTRVSYFGSRTIISDADQRRLITQAGVEQRWDPLGEFHSTREEAIAAARRLRALAGAGSQRPPAVVVVTSPVHTRRACATFEQAGMRVICVPALERGDQAGAPRKGPDRLGAFRDYVYERLAWWLYQRRGWVRAR